MTRVLPVQATHRALEHDAWELLAGQLSAAQTAYLHELITRWRTEHPKVSAVGYIHFAEFAKSLGPQQPDEEHSSGNLLSLLGLDPLEGLDPAVRELTQSRQLAERTIFYVQRAPRLINMQVERLSYQIAAMPEAKALLADADRVALIGTAADRLSTSIPDLLTRERRAFVSQLMRELESRRDSITAVSGNLRSTLQTGTEAANALRAALEPLDRITARFSKAEPQQGAAENQQRPSDLQEYREMLRELTVAARELEPLVQRLDTALPAVRSTAQGVATALDQTLHRAFLDLLALILVAIVGSLLAALAYRVLAALIEQRRSPTSS